MNSRLMNIILPVVASILYICLDFVYVYLSKGQYEEVFEKIQKEKMQFDMVAALVCYTG